MALYSHLATVRYLQGQGNAALYVRLRDGAGLYYDFVNGTWEAVDAADNRTFLTEVDDASAIESRYSVTVSLPEVNAPTVLEYVRVADSMVIAEESIPSRSAVTGGPWGGTALTSVAAFKEYLALKTTTDDNLLARIIVAASGWFEGQIGRHITLGSYTDEFIGDGSVVYVPRECPAVTVTSVLVDGNTVPQALTAGADGWRLAQGIIYLRNYSFTRGAFVQVAYTAGFSTVPAEVEQAVIEVAADRYQYRTRVGQVTKSMGGESVSFVSFQVPVSVKTVIDIYRRETI